MAEPKDQYMKKCAICGKDIFVPVADLWQYKRMKYGKGTRPDKRVWFCSYGCTRKWDELCQKQTTR